jgi:hypothetical protein
MAQSSPANRSITPSNPGSASAHRAMSRVYSEELRQQLINRALSSVSRAQKDNRSSQILFGDENHTMVNPPYGYLPFALAAQKGLVKQDQLKEVIKFCKKKKDEYAELGDYSRMWRYAQREALLSGILSHIIKFKVS